MIVVGNIDLARCKFSVVSKQCFVNWCSKSNPQSFVTFLASTCPSSFQSTTLMNLASSLVRWFAQPAN